MARPIVVIGSRRPHAILLLAYSAFAGAIYLHQPPAALAAYVPHWEVVAWSVLMLASGGIGALASVWWRSLTALRIAAGALVANTAGLILFVAAAFAILPPWDAVRGASWIVAWAVANVWQAWQIHRVLRGL